MSVNPYIECGKIVNTHGCHGGLKLESWCNTPEELAVLKRLYIKEGEIYREYRVTKSSAFKQFVLVNLDLVQTMDDAMAHKGKLLYAKREDFHLEDGEYFIADLIGLKVIHADTGAVLGTVKETINRGASDLYVVKTETGECMIPSVPEFVERVDPEKGIFVRPIEGMLD
ncbi:MAG: 16S rRNA processing protein RimM [Clostridia bacterium]|nr:16S rRNA processing protein RimM [Clostridia bacterium]